MKCKMLLFDLDGTLLQTDKTISRFTMQALQKCRKQGIMIGVSTSRSEKNSMEFITELDPDVVISSAGALVKYKNTYIYKAEFTQAETKDLIKKAREICGEESEITIDTVDEHYWNYKLDPKKQDKSWGDSVYTDFNDFNSASLKMCVEIFDEKPAEELRKNLPQCDCVRFSDGFWYKFTKKTATKENAILHMCEVCGITTDDIVAFGDDFADIGMLKLCGVGVAMGNAIDEVKAIADCVIGDNDTDGIGQYLLSAVLQRNCDKGYKNVSKKLIYVDDFTKEEIYEIFKLADKLTNGMNKERPLEGKTIVLFFPESSIRTRVTFEKGIQELGGKTILFPPSSLDKKEKIEDVIGYLENWVDAVVVRHNDIRVVKNMAACANIPVINAMTSENHPCEIISDLYALSKLFNGIENKKFLFVGAKGNIGNSWKNMSELIGFELEQCCPAGYELENVKSHTDLEEAILGKDIICTDSIPDKAKDDVPSFF